MEAKIEPGPGPPGGGCVAATSDLVSVLESPHDPPAWLKAAMEAATRTWTLRIKSDGGWRYVFAWDPSWPDDGRAACNGVVLWLEEQASVASWAPAHGAWVRGRSPADRSLAPAPASLIAALCRLDPQTGGTPITGSSDHRTTGSPLTTVDHRGQTRTQEPSQKPTGTLEEWFAVCESISDDLRDPDSHGPWRSPMFEFNRRMIRHPDAVALEPEQVWKRLRKWANKRDDFGVEGWCNQHFDDVKDRRNGDHMFGEDDAEAEVLRIRSIRTPAGVQPIETALVWAEAEPLGLPNDSDGDPPSPGYSKFISLAGWCQVASGNKNIVLPVIRCGDLLDVRPNTISAWRKRAIEDGYLLEVKPYRAPVGKARGAATEFRFDVSLFPILSELCPWSVA